jgi:hypothetical protein
MKIKTLVALMNPEQRERFAKLAGTKPGQLLQLAGGWRRPSLRAAGRLVAASRSMFPRSRHKWLSLDEFIEQKQFTLAEFIERSRSAKRSEQRADQ